MILSIIILSLYYVTVPYHSITGFTLNGIFNPELKWETVKQGNIGMDLAMFRERLIIKADWYRAENRRYDYHLTLPAYYGFDNYITNGGSVPE